MINKTFQEFIQYLKKPNAFIREEKPSIFFNQLFPLVIIALGFSFLSIIFTNTLEHLHLISKMPDFELFKLKEKKVMLFLMVVVLAPILEEGLFRYQLKNRNVAAGLYFLFIGWILKQFISGWLVLAIIFPIAVLFIFIFKYLNRGKYNTYKMVKAIFPYHFFFTAIAFGLVHITNYNNPTAYGLPIVLLVLPQLFLGMMLGYVRIRFGLSKSMIFHAVYNFIPALALIAGY